jgi:hypothetical protein
MILTIHTPTQEMVVKMLLVKEGDVQYEHCYRCCLQLTPEVETGDGHCPRCGYDLTIFEVATSLATEEQLVEKQASKEMYHLCLMVQNWAKFHKGYVSSNGVDWSAPHELVEMIGMQMMPWIARLVQTGAFKKEHVQQISAVIDKEVEELIAVLEAEEDILRLTGQWSDNEQSIKEYWKEKMGGFSALPMRNFKRIASD